MKKITLLFLLMLTATFGFAQQEVLEDFEGSPSVSGFEGLASATIEAAPAGSNGNSFKLVTNTGGQPWQGAQIDLASGVLADLTSDKTMKVDVYSTTAFSLMVKVEDQVNMTAPAAANTQDHSGSGWETLTFTFTTSSDGTAVANGEYSRVVFFPNRKSTDDGWNSPIVDITIYVDNITAVKATTNTNTDATLSDLQVDGNTVAGFAPATYTYNVELANGTTTVPTVTATATQAGSGSSAVSVSPAGSLPGTTTVSVTAPDGTTMQDYTINFTVASAGPTVAAPTPPARTAADVVSIFSDAYSDVTVDNWGPDWGPSSARINDVTVASNATKLMDIESGQVFAGIDFAASSPFDATSFTHFHLDYYISGTLLPGQTLSIKLSNHGNGAGETSAIQTIPTAVAGSWQSLDVALADFVAASAPADLSRNAIAQIVISAARADNSTSVDIYLDNIYFHKNTTLSTKDESLFESKIYPNPSSTEWKITVPNNTIRTIEVFNVLGKRVVSQNYNSDTASISVESLASGIYLAKINTELGTKTVKLIRE